MKQLMTIVVEASDDLGSTEATVNLQGLESATGDPAKAASLAVSVLELLEKVLVVYADSLDIGPKALGARLSELGDGTSESPVTATFMGMSAGGSC